MKSRKINNEKDVRLLVHGQGVYVFSCHQPCSFLIINGEKDGLIVVFYVGGIKVSRIENRDVYLDKDNSFGIISNRGAYYWFSLDSQNQTFYAGIGEPRIENVVYKYKFDYPDLHKQKTNKKFLESLISIRADDNIKQLRLLKDPITGSIPLKIVDKDVISLNDLASQKYMIIENLSLVSQKLYNSISGKNFILNDKDFPNFSKAIEYSIATEGCWCNKRLKEKAGDFNPSNPNILETYLRITMGKNNGESPGIPYVIEIWPQGHYSPIHAHGNCEAIIRVLHGSINVSLYPFLCLDKNNPNAQIEPYAKIEPFAMEDFSKGDVTWITPTLNQVHQLKNIRQDKACVTVQCYMYDDSDLTHYDYFDYIDEKGDKKKFEPDSDMDFISFKQKMKEEWDSRPKSCIRKLLKF